MGDSHDWIPLLPYIEIILKKAKGEEINHILESFFAYAKGDMKEADRLKRKVRKSLWKYIDTYRLAISQCYEVTEDYAEQDT